MQYQLLVQSILAIALATPGTVAANVLDKATYSEHMAPAELQRIANYRQTHANTLNDAQNRVLDDAERIVTNFDFGQLPSLQTACNAAFGETECSNILKGDRPPAQAAAMKLRGRGQTFCSCTDEWASSDCPSGISCDYGRDNCGMFCKSIILFFSWCVSWLTCARSWWLRPLQCICVQWPLCFDLEPWQVVAL